MKELPQIVVDEKGYLRVKTPDGYVIPDCDLSIVNGVNPDNPNNCMVTVTFLCKHNLKNKE